MTDYEKHDILAPEIARRILTETSSEADAMIVLESVILGIMLYHRRSPEEAAELVGALSGRVLSRMVEILLEEKSSEDVTAQ